MSFIGDQLDSGSTLENIFSEAAKMFLIYYMLKFGRMTLIDVDRQ